MNSAFSYRAAMLAGVAVVAIAAPATASAQAISFRIAAQDLQGALEQFARTADQEILYAPELVADRRSAGATGVFTPDEALQRILAGTDLTYRRTGANVYVLQSAAARAAGSGSLQGSVRDAATGTALSGAAVRIVGSNLTAVSDERGVYRFPAVPAGDYSVVLDYLGSQDQTAEVTITAGEEARLDFAPGDGDGFELAPVTVSGYANAVQRALNQQRTAHNSATIVSEDTLGGFPAETVSEALRRVSGVSYGRAEDTGEGSRILVRGFNSEAINVQVNGAELQGTNFERTIDLSGYLAENISQVTIHKSLLPSHESTGSGGLVEIETRSGLDYGDFHVSGGIEGERALESGFGDEYQANLTVARKFTDTFGVAATLSYRDSQRTNFDVFNNSSGTTPAVLPSGYTSLFNIPSDMQFPFDPEFADRLDSSVTYIGRDREETNLAASLNLAWDIADHTRLRFDVQHNRRDASTFFSRAAVQFLTGGFDMPIPELGGEVRRRFVLNSLRPGISLASSDVELVTNTVSFRGDTNIGAWQFRYKAGYSGAHERSDNNDVTLLGNTFTNLADLIDPSTIRYATDDDAAGTQRIIGGGFVDAANGVPVPSLTAAGMALLSDASIYRITSAGRGISDSPTDAWFGEASARRYFSGWLDYIEVGSKYDRSERAALDDTFATNAASLRDLQSWSPISGRNTFLSDINPALLGARDLSVIGLGGFGVPAIDWAGNSAIFDGLQGLLVDDPSTPFNEARFTLTDVSDFDPALDAGALRPASSVEEKWAGYVESHVQFGDFDLIGGFRVERSERVGTAISIPQVTLNTPTFQREPQTTFAAAGLIDFESVVAVDTIVTPSFLLNYRPATNIVARLGYFQSTVNPSLQSLRRQQQIFIDLRPAFNQAILAEGNPDIEPTVTDNWDFDVAYYFEDTPGLVRLGVFHKKVENNFTNLIVPDVSAGEVRDRIIEHFGPLATSRPDLVAFNADTNFILRRPVNGEGGTIWGVEAELIRQFDFLPGFWSDFGFIGNVTYTKSDFPTLVSGRDATGVTSIRLNRPLEGQSAWVYNAGLTYSRGGFEGRLVYTEQTESASAYDDLGLNTIVPAYATLDLRMGYSFGGEDGKAYTVFLEGDDLLRDADEPDIRSATSNAWAGSEGDFFFPNTYQFSGGRTLTLGLRARF